MRPPKLTVRILDTLRDDGPQVAAQIAERLGLNLRLTSANLWRMKNAGWITSREGERPLVYEVVDDAAAALTRRLAELRRSLDEREHLLEPGVIIRFKNGSLAITKVEKRNGSVVITGELEALH